MRASIHGWKSSFKPRTPPSRFVVQAYRYQARNSDDLSVDQTEHPSFKLLSKEKNRKMTAGVFGIQGDEEAGPARFDRLDRLMEF